MSTKKRLTESQERVVNEFFEKFNDFVNDSPLHNKQIIYFSAPTGAGKTFIVANIFSELYKISVQKSSNRSFTTLFIAPSTGQLGNQAFLKLKEYSQNQEIEVPLYKLNFISGVDGLRDSFQENQFNFIEWSKINNKKNNLTAENEILNFYDSIRKAAENGLNFLFVIDEEHYGAGKVGGNVKQTNVVFTKIQEIINSVNSNLKIVILRVSATPSFKTQDAIESSLKRRNVKVDHLNISYSEASSDFLVKSKIRNNYNFDFEKAKKLALPPVIINDFEQYKITNLLDAALDTHSKLVAEVNRVWDRQTTEWRKKNSVFKEYNPLIIIQVVNDKKTDTNEDEATWEKIASYVTTQIAPEHRILKKHVARWYSNKKELYDGEDIKKTDVFKQKIVAFNSKIKILVFKQAIATGWDIPRAQIYIKLRDIKSETLKIQTLGRILRNPFYSLFDSHEPASDLLTKAFIYNYNNLEDYDENPMGIIEYGIAPLKERKIKFEKIDYYEKTVLEEKTLRRILDNKEFFRETISNFSNSIFIESAKKSTNSKKKSLYNYIKDKIESFDFKYYLQNLENKELSIKKNEVEAVDLISNISSTENSDRKLNIKRRITLLEIWLNYQRLFSGIGPYKLVVEKIMKELFKKIIFDLPNIKLKVLYLWASITFNESNLDVFDTVHLPSNNHLEQSKIISFKNLITRYIFNKLFSEQTDITISKLVEYKRKIGLPKEIILDASLGGRYEKGRTKVSEYLHAYKVNLGIDYDGAELELDYGSKSPTSGASKPKNFRHDLFDNVHEWNFFKLIESIGKGLKIEYIIKNEKRCFTQSVPKLTYIQPYSYPFITNFIPDFIIGGKLYSDETNSKQYQIFLDYKGSNIANEKNKYFDEKTVQKLKYGNSFLKLNNSKIISNVGIVTSDMNENGNYNIITWNVDTDEKSSPVSIRHFIEKQS